MPNDFKYLSPREFQALSEAGKKRYLDALHEHLHGLPEASKAARQDVVDFCPFCGAFLCRIYADSGERSDNSAPVMSDEHGKHSICLNRNCNRKVELQEIAGAWVVAPGQRENGAS